MNASAGRLPLKQGAKPYADDSPKSRYCGLAPSPPKVNPLSGESAQASWYAGWKCGPVRLVSMAVSLLHHAAVFCGIRSQFKKFTS